MSLYQKFRKLKIDHAAIGLELTGAEVKYFCTPKGARIIGSAGVDGIHYCFVRGQEEMVFAVSPMNPPGSNVFPIARTFEELLSLLMACGSMAAIEQTHQWDEEQFDDYVAENQPTQAALAVFAVLRDKLGIMPMEQPFTYLRRLQDSYNYGALDFSKEYYEIFNAVPADEIPAEWKVTMEGGFRPKRGKPGREISLNRQFTWGDEVWHVPAVYVCSGGLVVDFCAQVDTERLKAFYEKARPFEEHRDRHSEEEEVLLRNENPLAIDFRPELIWNSELLRRKCGSGQSWVPSCIVGEATWEDSEALWILEHYHLDTAKAWAICRCTFPREGRRKIDIESLKLHLERDKTDIPGIHFRTPAVGGSVAFIHPVTGIEHTLIVHDFEMQEVSVDRSHGETLEFPRHFAVMRYTISPELARDAFLLKDCDGGDSPRPKNTNGRGRFAMSVGVIGSTDGSTQVSYAGGKAVTSYAACSSLHFEPIQQLIEWRLIFREKMMDDITETLI